MKKSKSTMENFLQKKQICSPQQATALGVKHAVQWHETPFNGWWLSLKLHLKANG